MKVGLWQRYCPKTVLFTSLLLLAATGCPLLHTTIQLPGKAIGALIPGPPPATAIDPFDVRLRGTAEFRLRSRR